MLMVATAAPDGDAEVRSFFEVSPTAQLLLTPDRKVRVANAAAGRLFAPAGTALGGRPFTDLFVTTTRPAIDGLFAALSAPGASGQRVGVEVLGPDGRSFPVELLAVRLSPNGSSGFGIVARDLRLPAPGRVPSPIAPAGSYTLAELLMANRLRELV
jgi:PAS domain S-box-containing protein